MHISSVVGYKNEASGVYDLGVYRQKKMNASKMACQLHERMYLPFCSVENPSQLMTVVQTGYCHSYLVLLKVSCYQFW